MRFTVQHAHLRFEGLFLADTTPTYQLGLACIAHNFTLLFDVDHRYELVAYIHDEQSRAALLAALNLGRGGSAFKTGEFMQQIDDALPATATRGEATAPNPATSRGSGARWRRPRRSICAAGTTTTSPKSVCGPGTWPRPAP